MREDQALAAATAGRVAGMNAARQSCFGTTHDGSRTMTLLSFRVIEIIPCRSSEAAG